MTAIALVTFLVSYESLLSDQIFLADQVFLASLNPAQEGGETASIFWGVTEPVPLWNNWVHPRHLLHGRDVPQLDRTYDLEILHGTTTNALRRIAYLDQPASRGTWLGRVPQGWGFLQVIARPRVVDQHTRKGPVLPILNAPNLMHNPQIKEVGQVGDPATTLASVTGWPLLPRGEWSRNPGGPCPGESYIRFDWDGFSSSGQGHTEMEGEGVKIVPGRKYVVSGWLRADGAGGANLGVRFYDQTGKELGTSHSSPGLGPRGWFRFLQRLTRPPGPEASEEERAVYGAEHPRQYEASIPDRAAWMAPVIQLSDYVEWYSLFLGEED